ncbi:RT RNaseH 2 domain-containing protein [Abeliophyllum distichum]|uniref:RT RNaseH 2 domain-containing protein n=1 Tax=Abeliophyllum distichum TaxID=126358 RepID=A0ABD1V443_9LAMI
MPLYIHALWIKECGGHISEDGKQGVWRTHQKNNTGLCRRHLVVKSTRSIDHVTDLQKVFDVSRHNKLKLNLEKCVFGVVGGKFLGFMITQRGIEANQDKIKAILNMKSPVSRKEVQRLIGRIAVLNRFISRAADKCYHFFKVVGGSTDFQWTKECEESLEMLKQSLQQPPALTCPNLGDILSLYLSVSERTVSALFVGPWESSEANTLCQSSSEESRDTV